MVLRNGLENTGSKPVNADMVPSRAAAITVASQKSVDMIMSTAFATNHETIDNALTGKCSMISRKKCLHLSDLVTLGPHGSDTQNSPLVSEKSTEPNVESITSISKEQLI